MESSTKKRRVRAASISIFTQEAGRTAATSNLLSVASNELFEYLRACVCDVDSPQANMSMASACPSFLALQRASTAQAKELFKATQEKLADSIAASEQQPSIDVEDDKSGKRVTDDMLNTFGYLLFPYQRVKGGCPRLGVSSEMVSS